MELRTLLKNETGKALPEAVQVYALGHNNLALLHIFKALHEYELHYKYKDDLNIQRGPKEQKSHTLSFLPATPFCAHLKKFPPAHNQSCDVSEKLKAKLKDSNCLLVIVALGS